MAKKQKKKEGKETEIMFKFIVQKHFSSKEYLNLDFEKNCIVNWKKQSRLMNSRTYITKIISYF